MQIPLVRWVTGFLADIFFCSRSVILIVGGDFDRDCGGDFGVDCGGDFGGEFGGDFGGEFGGDFGEEFGGDFGEEFGRPFATIIDGEKPGRDKTKCGMCLEMGSDVPIKNTNQKTRLRTFT